MTIKLPLVVYSGEVSQLDPADTIKNPETTNFTYNAGQLVQITTATGTINLTYVSGKLATVYNSKTGKTATYTYVAGKVSYITITP